MADTESGQGDGEQPSVSNTMGAIIIALLLILGGVILYQNSQLNIAMDMLNLLAQDYEARGAKK